MRIGRTVNWERDVLETWKRAAHNPDPNPDVIAKLPPGICWCWGIIEATDISRIYTIGSLDWKNSFGTYRLPEIARQIAEKKDGDDEYQHCSKVREIALAYVLGKAMDPLIAVAYSGEGPFVLVDGNHRAIALQMRDLLVGRPVFLGLHELMGVSYKWFRFAVACGQPITRPTLLP